MNTIELTEKQLTALRIAIAEDQAKLKIRELGIEAVQQPKGTQGYRRCDLSGLWILQDKNGNYHGCNFQERSAAFAEFTRDIHDKNNYPADRNAIVEAIVGRFKTLEERIKFSQVLDGMIAHDEPANFCCATTSALTLSLTYAKTANLNLNIDLS